MSKPKLKPAVLCLTKSVLDLVQIPENAKGIFSLNLSEVAADQFHFINRSVVDNVNDLTIGKAFPHLIGYVTVKLGDKYLSYSRENTGGETRLAGRRSIGIGGHTDIEDVVISEGGHIDATSTLENSICRELEEEIGLDLFNIRAERFDSLIVDRTDEVGSVHLGVPLIIEIKSENEIIKTDEVHDIQWLTKEQLLADFDAYENWSKIVIESL